MENKESFTLRWDAFEANTCVVLKELREEREFCDVTLVCDGKQVSAHKVILAGGSNFFQQILKQNPHPHPLLYLKGVRYDYLLSMLDFVYTGEANINEMELKSFLDVANDLQIKGLIEKNPLRKPSAKEGDTIRSNISHQNQRSDVKKEAGSLLLPETPSQGNNGVSLSTCEEGSIDTPFHVNIKVELDDTIHSTAFLGMEANSAGLNDREDEDMIDFKTEVPNSYGIGSILKNEQMTGDWYKQSEDFIEEGEESNNVSERHDGEPCENHNDKEFSTMTNDKEFYTMTKTKGRKVCSVCGKSFQGSNYLKWHTRVHSREKPFPCLICPKAFVRSSDLKKHTRIHTGEKPFQCLVCFKRFTFSSALNFHKKRKDCYMNLGE